MSEKIKLIKEYYHLLEKFSSEKSDYTNIFHPEISVIEYPNAINKQGQTRSVEALYKGMEAGKKILKSQHFEIQKNFECGENIIIEAKWTGEVLNDIGPLKKGQILIAHLCTVFEFKEGKIFEQRNYDCYEQF